MRLRISFVESQVGATRREDVEDAAEAGGGGCLRTLYRHGIEYRKHSLGRRGPMVRARRNRRSGSGSDYWCPSEGLSEFDSVGLRGYGLRITTTRRIRVPGGVDGVVSGSRWEVGFHSPLCYCHSPVRNGATYSRSLLDLQIQIYCTRPRSSVRRGAQEEAKELRVEC